MEQMTFETPLEICSKEEVQLLLERYDNFLLDCDGVVWLGEHVIPGMVETIEFLENHGKSVVFVTNNSSKSRAEYLEKFHRLGFSSFRKEQIYPTCYAAVSNLESVGVAPGAKVWVLGDSGIMKELKEGGYVAAGGTDSALDGEWDENHPLLAVDPEVQAVIVGSTKRFNYMRIALTLQYLLHENKRLPFIGTNIDRTYPGPRGMTLPAGGSVVEYMAHTSDREFLNVGKPSTQLLDTIIEENGFDRDRTLMVGDTLYTDIKFGNDGNLGKGFGSLLVLTGGTKAHDLENVLSDSDHSHIPLYVMNSFGDISKLE